MLSQVGTLTLIKRRAVFRHGSALFLRSQSAALSQNVFPNDPEDLTNFYDQPALRQFTEQWLKESPPKFAGKRPPAKGGKKLIFDPPLTRLSIPKFPTAFKNEKTLITPQQSQTYRNIFQNLYSAAMFEYKNLVKEELEMGISQRSGPEAGKSANSRPLFELEKRGLAAFGLTINKNFTLPSDSASVGLTRTKNGQVAIELTRNIEEYGPLLCKGFKPGDRVSLKIARSLFANSKDSRECENHEKDPAVTCEILKISPSLIQLEFIDELPFFINQEFSTVEGCGAEFFICRSARADEQWKFVRHLQNIVESEEQEITTFKNGPLPYLLNRWDKRMPSFSEKLSDKKDSWPFCVNKKDVKNKNLILDRSQMKAIDAVVKMVDRDDVDHGPVTIIHGPPGTGKTTVVAEAVYQITKKFPDKRILVVGPSHAATDNICLSLGKYLTREEIFRYGRVSKVTDEAVTKYMPAMDSKRLEVVMQRTKRLLDNAKTFQSTEESFQFDQADLKRQLQQISNQLHRGRIQSLKNKRIVCSVLGACVRMSSSNSTIIHKEIKRGSFDVIVFEEGGFVTLAEALEILPYFSSCIVAGDHLQLPPVVKTEEAKRLGYDKSFMEYVVEKLPSRHFLLETQYRSHFMISGWSSRVLYESRLKAGRRNKNIRLADSYDQGCSTLRNNPLIWLDHAGLGYNEGHDDVPDSHESYHNEHEAKLVARMYDHFRNEMGIPESEVGIISCYWAQVAHIRQSLEEINPAYSSATVRTIDGYQGKEKDVIIVSMARSNLSWDLGMMDDVRRINVAITRAKRHCCLIGDSQTFSYDENYEILLKGLKKKNCVVSLRSFQQKMEDEGFDFGPVEIEQKFAEQRRIRREERYREKSGNIMSV